jgi:hypothetical protein
MHHVRVTLSTIFTFKDPKCLFCCRPFTIVGHFSPIAFSVMWEWRRVDKSFGLWERVVVALLLLGLAVPWMVKPSGKAPLKPKVRARTKLITIVKMPPPWWKGLRVPQVGLWYTSQENAAKRWVFFQNRLAVKLSPGAGMQFRYDVPMKAEVMVFAVGANGKPKVYIPRNKRTSLSIAKGKGVLPVGEPLRLPEAKGTEALFIAMSDTPFGVDAIYRRVGFLYRRKKGDLRRFPKRFERWWLRPVLLHWASVPKAKPAPRTTRPAPRKTK